MMCSAFNKNDLTVGRIRSLTGSGIEKPVVIIREFISMPKAGSPAILLLPDGRKIKTSNVVRALLGGQTYIETNSTIYVDMRFWEAR